MSRTIWRYEIPVDDQPHTFELTDFPIRCGLKKTGPYDFIVEFWAVHHEDSKPYEVTYRVIGTGHPIPDNYFYVDTAPRDEFTGLVFHVLELLKEEESVDTGANFG